MSLYEPIIAITFLILVWFVIDNRKGLIGLPLFLSVVTAFELIIKHLYFHRHGSNLLVLNFYSRICVYYYLFIYWYYFRDRKWMRSVEILILLFILSSLLVFFVVMPALTIDYLSYNLGMCMVLTLIGIYLYDVIYSLERVNVFRDPYFYFSFGILIFFTASFPILGFINLLIVDNPNYEIYADLLDVGNIFLCLAYLGALLCSKKLTRSTGLSSHPL